MKKTISVYIPGYPRIGKQRELKTTIESYFRKKITEEQLIESCANQEKGRLEELSSLGLETVPVGDFSLYDTALDLAFGLGMIPQGLKESSLSPIEQYFALARGHQDDKVDIKAWPMKKWFTTNYHYVVPQFKSGMQLENPWEATGKQWERSKSLGLESDFNMLGPFTFFALTDCEPGVRPELLNKLEKAFKELLISCYEKGIGTIHFDESILVSDQAKPFAAEFTALYSSLLAVKDRPEIHIHSSFDDLSPLWNEICQLPFDGLGFDLLEGEGNLDLLEKTKEQMKPKARTYYAGLVNGKNIWKSDYRAVRKIWDRFLALIPEDSSVLLSSASSLLYVPYSKVKETKLPTALLDQLSFAEEKIQELIELSFLLPMNESDIVDDSRFKENQSVLTLRKELSKLDPPSNEYEGWQPEESSFSRSMERQKRLEEQDRVLNLPVLPTTTIGSFPQTLEVRKERAKYRRGEVSKEVYEGFLKGQIKRLITKQEELGIDVLVHGEYERTDMVEYFGQHLSGFAFTEHAWVQSYGVRGVKPPIIFGDISRRYPISVQWFSFAQSLSSKPVKGMLTGPITIYNWSFPGEHLPFEKVINELGLALRHEIIDLEKAGAKIIQLDEAALRERLPLKKGLKQEQYLKTAVRGFRLAVSGVKSSTQIHTHMCYSDFGSIYSSIIDLDADVISIEAAKSEQLILNSIKEKQYPGAIGPGVYDIHSPRIPQIEEIETLIHTMLSTIDRKRLWINPDCGLKTRGESETWASLEHMVEATQRMRST